MSTSAEIYEQDIERAGTIAPAGTGTNVVCQNKAKIFALLDEAAALAPVPANFLIIGAKLGFNVWCDKHCKNLI
ncbi:hypothetical protein [Pseudomonas abieticivorans]|uniref:hypothetical protein n=1 Tax=Pseudomonas abieticivorans TaxID=2931382 RepID=UPI0020BDBA76|nr:hypothetical protein [Pseudomonas sp. PIA16]